MPREVAGGPGRPVGVEAEASSGCRMSSAAPSPQGLISPARCEGGLGALAWCRSRASQRRAVVGGAAPTGASAGVAGSRAPHPGTPLGVRLQRQDGVAPRARLSVAGTVDPSAVDLDLTEDSPVLTFASGRSRAPISIPSVSCAVRSWCIHVVGRRRCPRTPRSPRTVVAPEMR